MKTIIISITFISLFALEACSQSTNERKTSKPVGEYCENCTAVYDSPIPFDKLSNIDTLPDYNETGPKIFISGIVYKPDGKTPAPGVVIYIYHTDQEGNYANKYKEKGLAGRHGYIKGWMRTNEKGEYGFYTLKPASYPNTTIVKHIHTIVKEEDKSEYSIDSYLFDDDPFLTPEVRKKEDGQKGGSGIIRLRNEKGILIGERNIYLGKNISGYPAGFFSTAPETGLCYTFPTSKYMLMTIH